MPSSTQYHEALSGPVCSATWDNSTARSRLPRLHVLPARPYQGEAIPQRQGQRLPDVLDGVHLTESLCW